VKNENFPNLVLLPNKYLCHRQLLQLQKVCFQLQITMHNSSSNGVLINDCAIAIANTTIKNPQEQLYKFWQLP